MRTADLPFHKTATFVLPRWKVVHVSLPKVACTSLKWLLADLQDEGPDQFADVLSYETSRQMNVHRRNLWQHTPMLHQQSSAELAQITPANGWFVFACVRHPSMRLWSAWQSKFLLREPRFVRQFPEAPWPRVPSCTADVVEDFQEFTRTFRDEPDQRIFHDRHFLTQARLLRTDRTPYSHVYKTSEIPQLLSDLESHLRPLGLEAMPDLPRMNETPLAPIAALFDTETLGIIEQKYAQDFEEFEFGSPMLHGLETGEYSHAALLEVGRLVDRHERIGDLVNVAVGWRDEQREAAKRIADLERELGRADRDPPAVRQQLGTRSRQVSWKRVRVLCRLVVKRVKRQASRVLRSLKSHQP